VIAKDNKPLGIITEKDIAWYLYTEIPNRPLDQIRLDEIMSENLITVGEQADLQLCARLMLENKISSILVVDNNKDLKGMITIYYRAKNSVEGYMTKHVLTITPDEPIHMVLLLMINNKISRIVVLKDEKPIGIITGRDLLPISALFMTAAYAVYWRTHEDLIALRKEQKFIPSGIKDIFWQGR
jgi:CBS domain-containing protein